MSSMVERVEMKHLNTVADMIYVDRAVYDWFVKPGMKGDEWLRAVERVKEHIQPDLQARAIAKMEEQIAEFTTKGNKMMARGLSLKLDKARNGTLKVVVPKIVVPV